ncbi:MAG: BCD family MFS transporter [Steroidobacteraceae bacterium]
MRPNAAALVRLWTQVGLRFLPFADAATTELPLPRLLRLSLFQVTVGMAAALLNGTLNRVMILELHVPAALVAIMVSLPLVFAPLRALVGHRSDHHRSALGWRRVPYIWFGTLLQFGGLAIMPFALLVLSGDTHGAPWIGTAAAAFAFLLVGAGMHTAQTAGLALAADLAPAESRPRVVALLYVMLLVGTIGSALAFGAALGNFSQMRLIQVIQGAALVSMVLNIAALWKQEPRRSRPPEAAETPFALAWRSLLADGRSGRFLVAVGLGAMAFSMQDILLEPYGGEIFHLSVGATTTLTAFLALGTLAAFALAAQRLAAGASASRLAATGLLIGIAAFSAVIFAASLESVLLFRVGTMLIGFGGGLFSVGTLTLAMSRAERSQGLALGAWGAVQASCAGAGIALGGVLRDLVGALANSGALGDALAQPSTGYSFVYHVEIALLFATLVAIGPLVRPAGGPAQREPSRFGLAEFPG